jgi:hypothetical protein
MMSEITMTTTSAQRIRLFLDPRPVRWRTVAALAVLTAYADGFWLIAAQGAVGAIERSQSPFASWLWTSTLVLPLYVLAVLAALGVARRRFGPELRSARTVLASGLLIVAAGTLLASGVLLLSADLDYRLQAEQLQFMHAVHPHGALDAILTSTRAANNTGARYATAADLITNTVVVGWVLALHGGRLVPPGRTPRTPSAISAPFVAPSQNEISTRASEPSS